MKFDYKYLKSLVPGLPPANKTAELLSNHLFETELMGRDILEVEVLANRYSDAACYFGLARELAAMIKRQPKLPSVKKIRIKNSKKINVKLQTKECRRLMAQSFFGVKIGPSPKWLIDVLKANGQQTINNLVDITNLATWETGQPLHAFDLDKMTGQNLYVRPAKRGEQVETLDGKIYELNESDLVLADDKGALDVAGIKGGKRAEIDDQTKNILLTAGNFNGAFIYKTSRKINLQTDASARFAHNLTPELVGWGMARASQLVDEICGGGAGPQVDVYKEKPSRHAIKFDVDRFNSLSGLRLKERDALDFLKRLDFAVKRKLVAMPWWRTDITRFEDLVEEVLRLYGYKNLTEQAPVVVLQKLEDEELVTFKKLLKKIMVGFGFDEVYSYSFTSTGEVEVENPVSIAYRFLRPDLIGNLRANLKSNRRFFEQVRIFEVGKVFNLEKNQIKEKLHLAFGMTAPRVSDFLEIKGLAEQLLQSLGLMDYLFVEDPSGVGLRVESDHHVIGYLTYFEDKKDYQAVAEFDLEKIFDLAEEERSYEETPRFPSIIRDLSVVVPNEVRFSKMLSLIERASSKYLKDVDVVDFYEDPRFSEGRQALTLRFIFLANDRTLTDSEVDNELKIITKQLVDNFDIEVR